MQRPDRVTRLIRLIAVNEAMAKTTSVKHFDALLALSHEIMKDLSDADHSRIREVRSKLCAKASTLMKEWATDTP